MKKYLDYFIIILVFLVGIIVGRWLFPRTIIKEVPKEKIVYIEGKTTTQTIIKYIPKETNPQTGQLENTDVEINIKKPDINVNLNGQNYVITPDFNESQIFENGKLVFNQSSSLSLNLNLPKPERKVELGFYAGLNNELETSFGGTLLIPRKDSGSYILFGGPHYDFKGWDLFFSTTW